MQILFSCNGDIDFGEQYQKTVYLVNSQNLLYTGTHFYENENHVSFSVYCASSEPITKDLTVHVKIDSHALDSLNERSKFENPFAVDKVMLPASCYQTQTEATVTVKAKEQYGILDVQLKNLPDLDPDVSYVLPLSIVSNSAGYDINPDMKSIVYEISMANKYSGIFSGSSVEAPKVVRPIQATAKAMSPNQVRLPIHNLSADNIDVNYMLLTITQDGTVSVSPWKDAEVTDLGGSYYDEVRQYFELNYRFVSDGQIFTVTEKIQNILAPKLEE
jgi:hypothetical protein